MSGNIIFEGTAYVYFRTFEGTRKYRYFRTSESTRAYLYEGMYEGTKVQRCPYYGGTFGTFVLSYKNSVSYKYTYNIYTQLLL